MKEEISVYKRDEEERETHEKIKLNFRCSSNCKSTNPPMSENCRKFFLQQGKDKDVKLELEQQNTNTSVVFKISKGMQNINL